MSPVTQVPAAHWQQWIADNDGVVLDVREPGEWSLGTLPGATLISMREIMDRVGELTKDTPVLCVCRSGARSGNVAAYLANTGYEAANLAGGMKALGLQD